MGHFSTKYQSTTSTLTFTTQNTFMSTSRLSFFSLHMNLNCPIMTSIYTVRNVVSVYYYFRFPSLSISSLEPLTNGHPQPSSFVSLPFPGSVRTCIFGPISYEVSSLSPSISSCVFVVSPILTPETSVLKT